MATPRAAMATPRFGSGASRAIILLAVGLASLLAQTVSAQDSFASSLFYNDKCPQAIGPNGNDRGCRCIRVRDYDDLRGAIRRMSSNECKCFEPFTVTKGPNDPPIDMDDMRRVTVVCQQFGSCIIQGPGTHFDIHGDESEVTLAGFRLMGATQSAVIVREDTGTDRGQTREQVFCDFEFVSNQNDWLGGAALFVGPRSTAYVKNTMFMQNAAQRMGGAIYSESSLLQVVESTFVSNYASIGGAVSSNMPDARLILADNEFERNVAGLGPTYGPAIAANGYVQDYGGNQADPKDFMCLHCKLNTGTRPPPPAPPVYAVDPNNPFVPQPGAEYVNIQLARAGNRVDNGQRADTDAAVDTKFELNRYRRYEPYQEEYELYPDDIIFGPFNIKLYFGDGYQWQEQYDDLNMCLESKYREEKVEGSEEPLQLYKCDEDEKRQRFVAVGKSIRLDEDRTLCLTYIDVRKIEVHRCTNTIYQHWDRLQADGKFRISPVTDHRRCMTNHHHPRNEERIYLEWCEVAEDADTLYWEVKWMEGRAPDAITMAPTKKPTQEPTISKMPTKTPTAGPTLSPTITKKPTRAPSASPTAAPTSLPTRAPTASPTAAPTFLPTGAPTASPTATPTSSPTRTPTADPSASPTNSPWDSTPEPQCGTQANGALCTPSGLYCCSADGYCGLGTKYCGEGCQSGMFCANPVPAPAPEKVEEDDVAGVEAIDEYFFDTAVGTKPGHSFVWLGSGGVDSINGESSPSDTVSSPPDTKNCGIYVEYIKNGVIKGKECDEINNPANVCDKKLANGNGFVWDVCCDQCESFR